MLFGEKFFYVVVGSVCDFYSRVSEDLCDGSGLFAEVCEFRPVCFLRFIFMFLGVGH
jgi:hypothetical protein